MSENNTNVFNIVPIIKMNSKIREGRILDAAASYTSLEKCLKMIEMNSLPELKDVKAMIRRTMLSLREIK